jgi:citrate synthase
METVPIGEKRAIYEFRKRRKARPSQARTTTDDAASIHSCMHLIAGMPTIAAAIARIRTESLPIEPDPELSHAANFLYMMTGKRPTPEMERVMDVALILHADHGMPASTFAAMVVASTLSDIYFSVGAGIAALNGPLHGGANEAVIWMLREIGSPGNVPGWFEKASKAKRKILGFGHRVYKAYDPRARILGPLAAELAKGNRDIERMYKTAQALEKRVVAALGDAKGIFPNVDFYSGLVYSSMGIPVEMFTPIFAVSRVAGWTARILEYLRNNRIFRPRAMYVGDFDKTYVPVDARK